MEESRATTNSLFILVFIMKALSHTLLPPRLDPKLSLPFHHEPVLHVNPKQALNHHPQKHPAKSTSIIVPVERD
ncbi:hypothetical protein FB446DRAFT_742635 [Lentinula raphanica]|nr:hypothetical protein FB446DRAFT_742635 [Lentinula raphanica]